MNAKRILAVIGPKPGTAARNGSSPLDSAVNWSAERW